MSSFKEMLKADIKNIFLNPDEFADTNNINGQELPSMIDEELVQEFADLKRFDSDGLYKAKLVLYVHEEDLNGRPVVGAQFKVNNKLYFVMHMSVDLGMYKILLGVNAA